MKSVNVTMKRFDASVSFVFVVLFAVMLCLNFFTVESVQDDYLYKFAWVEKGSSASPYRIRTVGDVISSQYYHYLYHNGRLVPHFILQLFDGVIGKGVFNILNSFMFCMLIWVINRMSGKRIRMALLLLSIALVFFLTPIFKETILWFAGSLNYLWPATGALSFMLIINNTWQKPIVDKVVRYSPIALVSGWTNEGVTIPVCLALGFLMLVDFRRVKNSATLPFASFFFLGTALTVFAPSTFNRMDELQQGSVSLVERCLSVFAALREVKVFWLYIFLLVLLLIYKRSLFKEYERENRLLILCVLFSFVVFFISTRHYPRVLFFVEMFSAVGIISLLYLFDRLKYEKELTGVCAAALILLIVPLSYYSYLNYGNSKYAIAQLKDTNRTIILTKADKTPRLFYSYIMKHVDYAEKDIWYWACENMDVMAKYYGKKSVEYYPEDLYMDMLHSPEHYQSYHTIEGSKLYAMQIPNGQVVKDVVFRLRPTDPHEVNVLMRPMIGKLERYSSLADRPRSFRTKKIGGHQFLIFTPPALVEKRERLIAVEYF